MNMIKRKKQFKKVSQETGILENYIMNKIYVDKKPQNDIDKEEIKQLVESLFDYNLPSNLQSQEEFLKIKQRVLRYVKPLLRYTKQQMLIFGKCRKKNNSMA